MNDVSKEIMRTLETGLDFRDKTKFIAHIGKDHLHSKPGSGRFPWGSGEHGYQRSTDFLHRYKEMKNEGYTEKEIAEYFHLSTLDLRMAKQIASHEDRQKRYEEARKLADDGKTPSEIARMLGYKNESSVRALLNKEVADRKNKAQNTADLLEEEFKERGKLDVSASSAITLGISQDTLKEARILLEDRGYNVYKIRMPNPVNKEKSVDTYVLCDKDEPYSAAWDYANIHEVGPGFHSDDAGLTFHKTEYPASIDSKRVTVRYADDPVLSGKSMDGVIEIRPGVKDLSLGDSHYAQVRILVDGTHYLKGMAIYSDDLPEGTDIRFNTNKNSDTPMMGDSDNTVLKNIKLKDPNDPFGVNLRERGGQSYYDDPDGKYVTKDGKHQSLSAINKLKQEGDWDLYDRNLSSQFLAKQPQKLIDQQLKQTIADDAEEYKAISEVANPVARKILLNAYAEKCDTAAVELKAAALPGQDSKVILPAPYLKDNEVYAPGVADGTKVALIRYPHTGTFEIPELTVNNKNATARKNLGNLTDAIGIPPIVAEQLSGADFDGDSVVMIPETGNTKIKSTKRLAGLVGFEPKDEYATHEETRTFKQKNKQTGKLETIEKTVYINKDGNIIKPMTQTNQQMGIISNLITDMTIIGASDEELTRAVKHSMVVIDAEKHHLDYKQSEKDNDIASLQRKFQKHEVVDNDGNVVEKYGGASTLLSLKGHNIRVPERHASQKVGDNGEKLYNYTNRFYEETKKNVSDDGKVTYTKTGKVKQAMSEVPLFSEYEDVSIFSTGSKVEQAYANYANHMKAQANKARKEAYDIKSSSYSRTNRNAFAEEVASINTKLKTNASNKPREQAAMVYTNGVMKALRQANPNMTSKEAKKIATNVLRNARIMKGADGKGTKIQLTQKEWDAIMAGAVSFQTAYKVMSGMRTEDLQDLAMPKSKKTLSASERGKMKSMYNSGNYTIAEIAEALGVSTSTVRRTINPLPEE